MTKGGAMRVLVILASTISLVMLALCGYFRHKNSVLASENRDIKNTYVICYLNSQYSQVVGQGGDEDWLTKNKAMEDRILSEVIRMGWAYQRSGDDIELLFDGKRVGVISSKKNLQWDKNAVAVLVGGAAIAGDGKVEVFR